MQSSCNTRLSASRERLKGHGNYCAGFAPWLSTGDAALDIPIYLNLCRKSLKCTLIVNPRMLDYELTTNKIAFTPNCTDCSQCQKHQKHLILTLSPLWQLVQLNTLQANCPGETQYSLRPAQYILAMKRNFSLTIPSSEPNLRWNHQVVSV